MEVNIDVPDGKSGQWSVETFEVSDSGASSHNMQDIMHGGRHYIKPGKYKRLIRNGSTIMSNTPSEINDNLDFYFHAKGRVLINGLGLGVALKMILDKKMECSSEHIVTQVTVIEISEDVIKLVADTFRKDSRVTIIQADAYTWKPPKDMRYNAVWHDIWDNICTDNLDEMAKLHRKYGRRCDWQDSWCRGELLSVRRREKKEEEQYRSFARALRGK
jgi:hypothetical protein